LYRSEWQDNLEKCFGKELEENIHGLIYIRTYSCRNLGNNKTTVRITNIPAKIRVGVLPDTRAEYYPVYCPPPPHPMWCPFVLVVVLMKTWEFIKLN